MSEPDLIGKKYNQLTILSTYWGEAPYKIKGKKELRIRFCDVKCDCGNVKRGLRLTFVKNGYTQSCGCTKIAAARELGQASRKDLIGQVFGSLTVTNDHLEDSDYCLAKCACNENEQKYLRNSLRFSGVSSCGCKRKALAKASQTAREPRIHREIDELLKSSTSDGDVCVKYATKVIDKSDIKCGTCGEIYSKNLGHLRRGQRCPCKTHNQKWTVTSLQNQCDEYDCDVDVLAIVEGQEQAHYKCRLCKYEFLNWFPRPNRPKVTCQNCKGGTYESRLNLALELDLKLLKAHDDNGNLLKVSVPHDWECLKCHHEFPATWNNVSRSYLPGSTAKNKGSGCPNCAKSMAEQIVRHNLEMMFGIPFPSSKPDFLLNRETGYRLELDGYCKELGIAFEHNGKYHYSCFHVNDDLVKRERYDAMKLRNCKEAGVVLVIIPQLFVKTKLSELRGYIIKELTRMGVSLPEGVSHETSLPNNLKYLCKSSIWT